MGRAGHPPRLNPAGNDDELAGETAPPIDADRAPFRRRPDSEVAAEALRHREERARFELARPRMAAQEAQRELQRLGRVAYRANVTGGRADRWFVSGMGGDVTDEQLIEKAEELLERRAA